MFCARFLCGLMCLGSISCSDSDGHDNGSQENAVAADGAIIDLSDDSTDPAVSLLDVGSGMSAMQPDAGTGGQATGAGGAGAAGGVGGSMPLQPNEPLTPDAGSVTADPDEENPMAEPEPADAGGAGATGGAGGTGGGGLVGTVCDLLGGLLCPVGLLCVEGLCQEPTD